MLRLAAIFPQALDLVWRSGDQRARRGLVARPPGGDARGASSRLSRSSGLVQPAELPRPRAASILADPVLEGGEALVERAHLAVGQPEAAAG